MQMSMLGFGKKKADKAAWCEAVYSNPVKCPDKEPKERLVALTSGLLKRHQRIINDSIRIIQTTRNADTRQGRIDLCRKHYDEMLRLKPFCNKEQLGIISAAEKELKGIIEDR